MIKKLIKLLNLIFKKNNKIITTKEKSFLLFYGVYTLTFFFKKELINKLLIFIFILANPIIKKTEKINNLIEKKRNTFEFMKNYSNNIDLVIEENILLKKILLENKEKINTLEKYKNLDNIKKTTKLNLKISVNPFLKKDKYYFSKFSLENNTKPEIGDLIVNEDIFLIGKVVEVYEFLKIIKIQLIDHKNSSIPVFIDKLNIQGTVNENNNSECLLLFIPENEDKKIIEDIKNGEIVYTSSVDNLLDENIIIGLTKIINNKICIERTIDYGKNELFLIKNNYSLLN